MTEIPFLDPRVFDPEAVDPETAKFNKKIIKGHRRKFARRGSQGRVGWAQSSVLMKLKIEWFEAGIVMSLFESLSLTRSRVFISIFMEVVLC
jgi:hypothetical protein